MGKSKNYDRWISRQNETIDMNDIQDENDLKIRTAKFLGYTPNKKQMDILKTYYRVSKKEETEKVYERKIYYDDKHYYQETIKQSYHLKTGEFIVHDVIKYRSSITGRFIKKPEGD